MSDNWVVQNLQNALDTWNSKLGEIWQLVTQTPETFKGGTICDGYVEYSKKAKLQLFKGEDLVVNISNNMENVS